MPGIFLDDRNIAVNKNKKEKSWFHDTYLCEQTLNNTQYIRWCFGEKQNEDIIWKIWTG